MNNEIEIFDKNGNRLELKDVLSTDTKIKLTNVNRIEVIDQNGRTYVNWEDSNKTEILVQDEGRTLKIFISK